VQYIDGVVELRHIQHSECSHGSANPNFPDPSANRLTMPIAWKGTLAQYAGRLHRLNDAKREVIIYDYADMRVPVLARMAAKRRVGYQAIGYKVLGTRDLLSGRAVASNESA
jgi:superfamily II DNA or RNA helicase